MAPAVETFRKQAARAAYGWGRPQSWQDALALLERAAEAGEADAKRELDLVTQMPLDEMLQARDGDLLSDRAQIAVSRGFAPPGFSEWLIDKAKDNLVAASVNEANGAHAVRSARDYALGPQRRDLILAIMQERAAYLTQIDMRFHEPPNVISYEPGEEFSLHTDFLDPRVAEYRSEIERSGQRIATVVTYLNSDFEGAETWFPDAGVKFRGDTGDAILFLNVLPDGSPDFNTRHAGLPPVSGRKWVLSQWMRRKPFVYRPEDLL